MIGVIGLGNMGYAIASRLCAEGCSLTVWNRTTEKADGLSGVVVAETPVEVVNSADITLCVLANDEATESVYFGDNGIVTTDLGGKVVVDMCTMAPPRARELETAVIEQNGFFLECPVGGTVGPALEGKLLGLAGGSDDAFDKAMPILQKLTRRLEHFGEVGTGSAMKLAVNLPLMVYWSALGEALSIAQTNNVDPEVALDVLSDSSGAIGAAKKRVPPIRNMVVNGDCGSTNFSIENAIKDMELMVATAAAHGVDAEIVSKALDRSRLAKEQGFSTLDCSLVAAFGNQQ